MPPIVAADLIAPAGHVEPSFFPGLTPEEFAATIAGAVAAAEDRVAAAGIGTDPEARHREAVRAVAYADVFERALGGFATRAATWSLADQGSRGHTAAQLTALTNLRALWVGRAAALGIVLEPQPTTEAGPPLEGYPSTSAPARVMW